MASLFSDTPPSGPYPDITKNKHGGNPESEAAFERSSASLPRRTAAVLEFIRLRGPRGATGEEIAEALGQRYTSVSGVLTRLKAAGLTGCVGTRPTSSGAAAAVHVATDVAQAFAGGPANG